MSKQVAVATPIRVVPKAKLDRRRFDPLASMRAAVALFEVPQRRLKAISPPNSKFNAPVDLRWLKSTRGKLNVGLIWAGSTDVVLSTAAGLPIALAVPGSFPILLGIWSVLQLGFLPLGVTYSRVHRAEKRNFNSFLLWLQARYNVTLNAKQGIPRYLRKAERYDDLWISDSHGRSLKLSNYSGVYITDAHSGEELEHSLKVGAPQKVKAAAVQLSAEAKVLFEQINDHLLVLSQRPLSPESDHVVNRAARDRDKVVALHADLVHLGIERVDPSQEEAIVNSFTTLLAELTAVVGKETKFALDALSVETTYVSSRKERKGIAIQK